MAVRLPLIITGSTGGTGSANEFRHEWIEPYSYCGVAPDGTPTSSPIWSITRIEVYLEGTTSNKSAIGPWDDRTTLIYT